MKRSLTTLALLGLLVPGLVVSACTGSKENVRADGTKQRTPPDEPWRQNRPPPGEAPEVKLPVFQRAQLKNGLTVLLAEEHSLPIVDMQVVVLAGSVVEKPDEAGLSALTFDMLDEGAGDYNALSLADAFAKLGTNVHVSSGRESGVLSLDVLKRNADAGLELLSLMVQRPTFSSDDFERVRERHLSQLVQRAGQPGAVASDVFSLSAYGRTHPYGQPSDGTVETVQKLNARRAKKFWTDHVAPSNAAVVFAGDLTLDEAKALAEKHFGKWKGRAQRPKAPGEPGATKLSIHVVDFPGAPQTVVRIGRPVLTKGDPDEPAFELMNQILGGMFSSRLNMNLREAKGWTYGAFSVAQAMRVKGPVLAGAGIKTEHTAAAVSEFFKEFARLSAESITEEELAAAKANYIKSLPGLFETVGAMGGAASALFVYDLPMDYYAKLPERIEAVTADDVKRAAERALVKDEMVVVLVGDAATIEPGLKELGLAEIVRVSPTGEKL